MIHPISGHRQYFLWFLPWQILRVDELLCEGSPWGRWGSRQLILSSLSYQCIGVSCLTEW